MITKFKLFEQTSEENWKLLLDISKIWNESLYNDANSLITFNDNYITFLNNQKDLIIKQTSQESWDKLQELVNRLLECKNDITDSTSVWDDIYDWADGNMVEIVVEDKKEVDF